MNTPAAATCSAALIASLLSTGCSLTRAPIDTAYTFPGDTPPTATAPTADAPASTPLARIAQTETPTTGQDQPDPAARTDTDTAAAEDAIAPPWFTPGVRSSADRVEAHASAAAADIPSARAAAIEAARRSVQIARTAPTEITITRIVALPAAPGAPEDARWIAYAEAVALGSAD